MSVTQPNLFGDLGGNAYGDVNTPIAKRDEALERVEAKATSDDPTFMQRATAFVLKYLGERGEASGEKITDACVAAGIEPENHKAFGAVYMTLARSGRIVKVGMCPREKGHGSGGANIWRLA